MISSKSPDLEDQFCRTKRAVDHEVSKGVVDLLEELLQDLDDVAVAVEAAERHAKVVRGRCRTRDANAGRSEHESKISVCRARDAKAGRSEHESTISV